jgi:hypothetical protein
LIRCCTLLRIVALLCTIAAVPSASIDGEATVYVIGDFTANFNVAYQATLQPSPANRSWTSIGIVLTGKAVPGPAVALGLIRGDPHAPALHAFTQTRTANGTQAFRALPVRCYPGCALVLRANPERIYAIVGTQRVGDWLRSDLGLAQPYVQLNAEVHTPGDSISAVLLPLRVVANSQFVRLPTCAFTARGIASQRFANGSLAFSGTYDRAAPAAFMSLLTGRRTGRCFP